MKRVLALALALVMACGVLVGCGSDKSGKGAVIPVNLTLERFNLDPGKAFYDTEAMKLCGLLYEGLTRIDENGEVHNALAKSWTAKIDEKKGEYVLNIELNNTWWSDGRQVLAEHVVYGWKRVLDPSSHNPAAALLYDIKNARKVKSGEMTVDDLGLAAPENLVIEVEFEGPFDAEEFMRTVASPALVPMREDVISKNPDTWATKIETIVTNGPFTVKRLGGAEVVEGEDGEEAEIEKTSRDDLFTIERSTYYYLSGTDNEDIKKYVTPYRFEMNYTTSADDQYAQFQNGELHYLGYLSKENYEANAKNVKTMEIPSAYTYYFNTAKAPLNDASVRKALANAISRDEIAAIVGRGVVPATGFVPHATREYGKDKEFRAVGGSLINTAGESASLSKKGSVTITYRNDKAGVEKEIAEYVQSVWKSMGLTVKIKGLKNEDYEKALYAGDFDVIAIDSVALTDDALSLLAPFAKRYSGSVVSLENDAELFTPHITGFENDEYDALIDKAYAAENNDEMNAALHQAEALLLEQCPATALYFDVDYYLADKNLTNIKSNFFGSRYFNKTDLKGYVDPEAAADTEIETAK